MEIQVIELFKAKGVHLSWKFSL